MSGCSASSESGSRGEEPSGEDALSPAWSGSSASGSGSPRGEESVAAMERASHDIGACVRATVRVRGRRWRWVAWRPAELGGSCRGAYAAGGGGSVWGSGRLLVCSEPSDRKAMAKMMFVIGCGWG